MTLPPILPLGTSIVTRIPVPPHPAGAVAVIVRAPIDPHHSYRVRFAGGSEATLSRGSFGVRKHEKARLPDAERDFTPYIQLRVVVGSRAFGLDTETSDTDLRGFYLPPAREEWSLAGVPEQLEFGEECYWEAKKFVLLALKANPNILEVLHSPLVLDASPLARELLDIRQAFLSKLVYQTYGGYVMGQFKRMEADLRTSGEVRWKHAMHLLRLLHSGTQLLRTGELVLDVGPERERLLAVKRGELTWAEVEAWRLELHAEFDRAAERSELPERPDYASAEDWLLRARRAAVEW
ncbi:DNA polymerase beta superfamily protein [Deinococcus lacus]|uniref:DNA polymerase beta superfamily protein n=1 Tax=Deinococcus lacus TaxID=392561 RepID=A0ABW1YCM6_9DEIO